MTDYDWWKIQLAEISPETMTEAEYDDGVYYMVFDHDYGRTFVGVDENDIEDIDQSEDWLSDDKNVEIAIKHGVVVNE